MPYVKKTWVFEDIISEDELNRMETQYDAAKADLDAHKTAAILDHPDGSVTDVKFGNRTIDDTIVAATGADTPTRLWSKLGNIIKQITGGSFWYTTPAMTIAAIATALGLKAPLASPALTGVPTAPTAAADTSTTQLATTAFVTTADNLKATKATKVSNTLLTTTVQTTIATFTPAIQGNFLVGIYFRVVTGTTNVTIVVTYNDNTGAQTNTMINAQVSAVGSYSLVPLFINAVSGTAITVKVTASVANQVYASASVVGV